jgi:hypothetical protein
MVLFHQPALCGHPLRCAGAVREGRFQLRDTVPPTPVPPAHRTPRERTREPLKAYDRLLRTRLGRRCDVRPARCVPSVTSGPMRPSPPLCRHPRHCSIIPGTVGAWDDGTPPHPPLYILRPSASLTLEQAYGRRPNKKLPRRHPQSCPWTITGLATTPARSEILQDNHQLHDTMPHAAICSTRAMRHDCKPPPLGL